MTRNPGDVWKRWLAQDLIDLRRDVVQRLFAQGDSYRDAVVERFMFMTAYVMRKLAENDELTVEILALKWPGQKFACLVRPPSRQWFAVSEDLKTWRQPLENHYDLTNPMAIQLSFPEICNLVIHHYAFQVRTAADGDAEVLLNSDRTKDEGLYLIAFSDYTRLVEEAAYDEGVWFEMNRAEGKVKQYRERPPGM